MQQILLIFGCCFNVGYSGSEGDGPVVEIITDEGSAGAMSIGDVLRAMKASPHARTAAGKSAVPSKGGKSSEADRENELDRKMQSMLGKPEGGAPGPKAQTHHAKRENDMDRAIEAMISDMFGATNDPFAGGPVRRVGGMGGFGPTTRMIRGPSQPSRREWRSPDGSQEIVIESGSDDPFSTDDPFGPRGDPPMDEMRGLFPGPIMIDDAGGQRAMSTGPRGPGPILLGGPDPFVMDMLKDAGQPFKDKLQNAPHESRAPGSCHDDLKEHCGDAKSEIHCLGQHQADVSADCRKDVGKSVPFLCHRAIDQYCDVLTVGLLSCLGQHTQELPSDCKDAVEATQQVVSKIAAQTTTTVAALAPSIPLLDNAAVQVANAADKEASASLLGASASSSASSQQAVHKFWVVVTLGIFVVAVYAFTFSDGRRRAMTALKPFIYAEAAQPLKGGVTANPSRGMLAV